jgi:hypothetical protein
VVGDWSFYLYIMGTMLIEHSLGSLAFCMPAPAERFTAEWIP